MCGRFCCALDPESLKNRLQKEHVIENKDVVWINREKHKSSYNVCPSNSIPALVEKSNQEKYLQSMQWGFIPSWAKTTSVTKPINARCETLSEKNGGIFDESKNKFRCIIVGEGFYEWNKKRQAFYVKRKDGRLMLFAGLYSTAVIQGEELTTCTMVTAAASDFFSKIHKRMPVILESSQVHLWLNNTKPWNETTNNLLKSFKGDLDCYQVSDKVGVTKNDSIELTMAIDESKNSISQFLKPVGIEFEQNKTIQPALSEKFIESFIIKSEQSEDDNKSNTKEVFDFKNDKDLKRKRSVDNSIKQEKKPKTTKITNFFLKE